MLILNKWLQTLRHIIHKIGITLNYIIGQAIREEVNKEWGKETITICKEYRILITLCITILLLALFEWPISLTILALLIIIKAIILSSIHQQVLSTATCLHFINLQIIYEQSHEVLQYIKFVLMIGKGYELRSNTNVIMRQQQQQEKQAGNEMGGKQIDQHILALFNKAKQTNLCLQEIIIMATQQTTQEQQKESHLNINSLIQLNHSLHHNIHQLLALPSQFQSQIAHKNTYSQIKHTLTFYRLIVTRMQQLAKKSLASYSFFKHLQQLHPQPQQQLYHLLTKQSNTPTQIQLLKGSLNQLKELVDHENERKEEQCSQHNERVVQEVGTREVAVDERKVEQQFSKIRQRKMFLQELNKLLIRGINLKKQQTSSDSLDFDQPTITLKRYPWKRQAVDSEADENDGAQSGEGFKME